MDGIAPSNQTNDRYLQKPWRNRFSSKEDSTHELKEAEIGVMNGALEVEEEDKEVAFTEEDEPEMLLELPLMVEDDWDWATVKATKIERAKIEADDLIATILCGEIVIDWDELRWMDVFSFSFTSYSFGQNEPFN